MRNDFIGTSIDGDARAACGCQHNGANTINTAGCGCDNNSRQPRTSCGCNHSTRQPRTSGKPCGCDDNSRSRHDDCPCDNDYTRQSRSNSKSCGCNDDNRSRSSDCACDNDYTRQSRSNGKSCGCDDNNRSRSNDCSCQGRTPAMVYAAHHDLDSAYCAEKALLRGTLFGCLDKPMCNERCTDNACASQCQEDKFSIWELRLYLNTHPCDQQALALLNKLTRQMDDDCSCTYTSDCNRWSWIDGPWPWEYQRCCGKEA